jgi:ADP-heptose:LPS heptosyltransferase
VDINHRELLAVGASRRAGWRGIERRVKSSLIVVLGNLMRCRRPRELPKWGGGPHRVLFLRYDRIGDMVLATGLIKAITSAQPTVTVDVLASGVNAAVLTGNPHVGSVLTVDRKRPWTYLGALWRIRRARYAAVVDPMVLAPSLTSLLFMWASGARHRIGISRRGNDAAFTLPVDTVHDAVHYIDRSAALLAAFGMDLREVVPACVRNGWGIWPPEIFLSAAEKEHGEYRWRTANEVATDFRIARPRLVVNVSASSRSRYWPEESFIQTLLSIRTRFPRVLAVIVGSPQDVARMARIGRAGRLPVAYTPRYRQMMAVVATSDLVFTADTAVTHIASAFGKPAVVMFVGAGGLCYGPYGTAGQIISTDGPSLDCLEVEPVLAALERLIVNAQRSGADSPDINETGAIEFLSRRH